MKRFFFGFILLILLTLGWLFLLQEKPAPLAVESREEKTEQEHTSPKQTETKKAQNFEQESEIRPRQSPKSLSQQTKELILECTRGQKHVSGLTKADDFNNLTEFFDRTLQSHGGMPSEDKVELFNVHIKTANGETLRLHLTPDGGLGDAQARMRIRLFGVDRENLPVPMPLPESLRTNEQINWQESVQAFKKQGEVIFEESIETRRWASDLGVRLTRQNGTITDLEMHFARRHLLCGLNPTSQDISCRCF